MQPQVYNIFEIKYTTNRLPWWLSSKESQQETWVQSLGGEDPLEKEKVAHCSILAWRIPWAESGGLQFRGSPRVGHN